MSRKPNEAEVLERAADLVEPRGRWVRDWTARRWINPDDKSLGTTACMAGDPDAMEWGGVGAIYKVGMAAGLTPQACFEIQKIAARAVGLTRPWFSDWAWAHGRTQAEVVAALRKAAELAREELAAA